MAQLNDLLVLGNTNLLSDLTVLGILNGDGAGLTSLNASNLSSGTVSVARGGTGKNTLTSGSALIGNGTSAVTLRAITNMTAKNYITYNTNLMTTNTLAYWNGAYNSSNASNLTYCNQGAFGTIVTKSTSDYLAISGGTMTGNIKMSATGKGYYLVDKEGVSYPGVYDNGTNLWIGSTATAATHHTGSTYISAGYSGSAGNDTIYISVPNAANNGGANYKVVHAGNFTSILNSTYVNVGGDTMSGNLKVSNGSNTLTLTTGGSINSTVTTTEGWARGFSWTQTDGTTSTACGTMGMFGSGASPTHFYIGDAYNDVWMKVTPAGAVTATSFVGSGASLTALNASNISSGTLSATRGGTGKNSLIDSCNALLNALTTGSSAPSDADYFISQYAGGGTTTTTYHRRPVSALWTYMQGKSDSRYLKLTGGTLTGDLALLTGDVDRFITFDYSTAAASAGASWRIGCLGSGSSNANYFVLQTTGSTTGSSETWANAMRVGMNNKDFYFSGTVQSSSTITGTQLTASSVANYGSTPPRIAVFNSSGKLYYRTPAEISQDIGSGSGTFKAYLDSCK